MKRILILSIVACLFAVAPAALAQGNLTPPGAPSPTMKTLDQIQPRFPISTAPLTITNPGSYYLTANLTLNGGDGIDVNTNNVTIDLNGFTIFSTATPASGTAIVLSSGMTDITVINGHIKGGVTNNGTTFSGPGFAFGIVSPGGLNFRVAGVSVAGCLYQGIFLGENDSSVVESCTAQNIGTIGIEADHVSRSSASQCGDGAIVATVAADCTGIAVLPGGFGVQATSCNSCDGICSNSIGGGVGINATTALNCNGTTLGAGFGVSATTANVCYGISYGGGTGINATEIATGCYGSGTVGIRAVVANSCISSSGDGNITHSYNMP